MTTPVRSEPASARTHLPPVALAAAVAGLFGSEIVHMAAIGQHIRFWAVEGWFFTLLAIAEGLLAAGLLLRATPRIRLVTFVVSVTTIAVWAMSRLNGLPFGPGAGEREIVGLPDTIATILEAVTAIAVFPGAVGRFGFVRRTRLAVASIVALSASLTSVALIAIAASSGVASTASHLH